MKKKSSCKTPDQQFIWLNGKQYVGLIPLWCIYTDIYIGGRPLALPAGLADPWPGEQQEVPWDSQALGFKPPHQFPALPQLRCSEDQTWKGGQRHRANPDVLHGHRGSGTGAAWFELNTGRTTSSKCTFTPVGWGPTAPRAEDTLA